MRGIIYIRPMVDAAVDGRPLTMQGGPMRRDYTSIVDTVAGIILALDKDTRAIEQRVFNISGGCVVRVGGAEVLKRLEILLLRNSK